MKPSLRLTADSELACWTDDSRAQEILASIAADPTLVQLVDIHPQDRWTIDTTQFAGPLVGELSEVWSIYVAALLEHAYATDDYEPHAAFCRDQPTVQQAITDALRIPELPRITTRARTLNPALWPTTKKEGAHVE